MTDMEDASACCAVVVVGLGLIPGDGEEEEDDKIQTIIIIMETHLVT